MLCLGVYGDVLSPETGVWLGVKRKDGKRKEHNPQHPEKDTGNTQLRGRQWSFTFGSQRLGGPMVP